MIISPMATGNGAFVVHKILEQQLNDYRVFPYHPLKTLFPPLLFGIGRHNRADLIHTTPDYAWFHARAGVPMVLTFHNYVLDTFMKAYSSRLQTIHYQTDLRWFTRQAVRKANVITAVSRFTANLAKQELGLENIQVIYNGVDENRFYPNRPQAATGQPVKVLFSGNLTLRKGAQWLNAIAERLNPNVRIFYTVGLRNNNAFKLSDKLQSLGSIRHQDMPEIYNQMDLLLFPTVREGFGLSVAEAMACGLPVVATDCSALPELIDEGRGGFLCPMGDVDYFAEKINQLADSLSLRRLMGDYNRAKIEQAFTLKVMVENYRNLFEELSGRQS